MSVEDKFNLLIDTKQKIRSAIMSLVGGMGHDTIFSEYADLIRAIQPTKFEETKIRHENFNLEKTYYNADPGIVWTGGIVNFQESLYDLDPSMIVNNETVLGIKGKALARSDNDTNALDGDLSVHRDRIDYIRRKSDILYNSKYGFDYYEGVFICETNEYAEYVFCLRNFDVYDYNYDTGGFKVKNVIAVRYYHSDTRYSASYYIDSKDPSTRYPNWIVYSSRYIRFGYFDSGHPYMPWQIYPKPFEVTINIRDNLLPQTTKLRFRYKGYGLLVRLCLKYDDDDYCFNWENRDADGTWHYFGVGLDEIPNMLNKNSVKLIIMGHITGLTYYPDGYTSDGSDYIQGLFSMATEASIPLPNELTDCHELFKNSKIKTVSNKLMDYCYKNVTNVKNMFDGCTELTSNIDNLFDKCTKLK